MLTPKASPPNPSPVLGVLEYRDRAVDRLRALQTYLRGLSAVLAMSAAVSAAAPWWYRLPPACSGAAALAAAVGLGLRAWAPRRLTPLRSAWALAFLVFGLWAAAVLSNQFHGRPPRSGRYLIAWWGMSCAAAAAGLVLEARLHSSGRRATGTPATATTPTGVAAACRH